MKLSLTTNIDQGLDILSQEERNNSYKLFLKTIEDSRYGFFKLPEQLEQIKEVKEAYKSFSSKKNFVQIGIGGSALGPQMLVNALGKTECNFIFLDNTDAEDTFDKLQTIDLKETVFYVVSKSGGTAETIANFIVCYNELKKLGIKDTDLKNYFVFSTDPHKGELREFSSKHDITCLKIPTNIGGRFSVLSSVGLFPALFAGINIEELYQGAKSVADQISTDKEESDLIHLAHNIIAAHKEYNISQTVLMPYSSKLKSFSDWFVQLWGESLGKINSQQKESGLTPLAAYGATDQHSQMQLYMEGPNNKFLLLLEVEKREKNFSLQNELSLSSAKKLSDHNMNKLIQAQLKGTLKALTDRKRNIGHLQIEKNNAYNLGALILFFESLTVLTGLLLEVDPFDQPGVELGKKYAFEYLNSDS